jgi:hypothetical protein
MSKLLVNFAYRILYSSLYPSAEVRTPLLHVLRFWFRGSSVHTATPYGTNGPGIEPMEAIFSVPRMTGLGSHPANSHLFSSPSPGYRSRGGIYQPTYPTRTIFLA